MGYWCAAQLQTNREGLALHMLEQIEGFTVYAPRLRQRRRYHGRWVETTPLLFVSYAFVLIELQWHRARWAPGVIRLIMDGLQPAKVPDSAIAELRRREQNGAVELPKLSELAPGDQVRIVRGPLRDRLGLYQGMKSHERVALLLTMLGGARHVTLARSDVAALLG
jgi:transcriptional antiterminator RfaH